MSTLDQRMDALLGEEFEDESVHPVILEMTEETARVVVEGLRWALYGGAQPPDGRRSLLLVLDALQMGLSTEECPGKRTEKSRGCSPSDLQAGRGTI